MDRDDNGRLLAVCVLGGEDLNAWLVFQGQALADRRFSDVYVEEEETAKAGGRRMWRGQYIEPWDWRSGTRLKEKGVPAAKKCKIKDTFNSKDKKIYHLQDQKFYALVSVDEAKKALVPHRPA